MFKRSLPTEVRLSDYHYALPEERIAVEPLPQRDQARLLRYQAGVIGHHRFFQLPQFLPTNTLLLFNDSKVIRARLLFHRETGAKIEVLLLAPVEPVAVEGAMQAQGSCTWQCVIGNRKRWKDGEILHLDVAGAPALRVQAELIDRHQNWVRFWWEPAQEPFVRLLAQLGELPLPPYLGREATAQDLIQYQTVYARQEGAVAAPTAGLHFTDRVLADLTGQGVDQLFVTLHVSAGTFLPVKTDLVLEHDMHAEQVIITRTAVQRLLDHAGPIVPVGTTSLRWLESLYWLGVHCLRHPALSPQQVWTVGKLDPYQLSTEALPPPRAALEAVRDYLDRHQLAQTFGDTQLLIVPGYTFRLTEGLITNYHLPGTTLILLVAALVGEDWRRIYRAALDEGYRFLSYGDSSLLLPGSYQ